MNLDELAVFKHVSCPNEFLLGNAQAFSIVFSLSCPLLEGRAGAASVNAVLDVARCCHVLHQLRHDDPVGGRQGNPQVREGLLRSLEGVQGGG